MARFILNAHSCKQFLFRFMPYAIKKTWNEALAMPEERQMDTVTGQPGANHLNSRMAPLFHHLVRALSKVSSRPTVYFHLYGGIHLPLRKDRDGEPLPEKERFSDSGRLRAGEWELRSFAAFLAALKEQARFFTWRKRQVKGSQLKNTITNFYIGPLFIAGLLYI